MTNEEASFILANIDRRVCDDELSDALDMAIKALEQQPCDDCISRQAAIDELDKGTWGVEWDKTLAKAMIESLPSAQPTRPTARWERLVDDFKKCSKCGKPVKFYREHEYCPGCGAKMMESEDKG